MIALHATRVEVVKFKETGVAALCIEVADFIRSGEAEKRRLDVDGAVFVEDDRCYKVVFPHAG